MTGSHIKTTSVCNDNMMESIIFGPSLNKINSITKLFSTVPTLCTISLFYKKQLFHILFILHTEFCLAR